MWSRTVLLLMATTLVCGQTGAPLSVSLTSNFCSQTHHRLDCVFASTNEAVVLEEVGEGVKEVRVEAATGLHGSPPCSAHLHIWSSINVTLQGPATDLAPNNVFPSQPRQSQSYIYFPDDDISPVRNVASSSSTSGHRVDSSVGDTSVPPRVSVPEGDTKCEANVSVVQSQVRLLRGQFDQTSLKLSEVSELEGNFSTLEIRRSSHVTTMSVFADKVTVADSKIDLLSHLEVEHQLQLQSVEIEHLVSPGITLKGRQDHVSEASQHTLRSVSISLMESEALHLTSAHASVTNLRIQKAGSSAITVQDGGSLYISNAHIHQGPLTCLTLHGAARVVVDNFTLGNDTIGHLEVSSKSSQKTLFPLFSVWPTKDGNMELRSGVLFSPDSNKTEKTASNSSRSWMGFPWYWIGIMLVVGIVAGVVVATSVMWSKPAVVGRQSSSSSSTMVFSDLKALERLAEEHESQTSNSPWHSHLTRQQSGLSSSSFASFTPCQERAGALSLSQDKQHAPVTRPSPTAESNPYVQMAPLNCAREEVIYEELEDFLVPRAENHYLPMK